MIDIGKALDNAGQTVGGFVRRVVDRTSDSGAPQTVTVTAPRARVMQFWRDPENLSRVFGERVAVATIGANRLRWTWKKGDDETAVWDTRVDVTDEGLAFVADDTASTPGMRVVLAVADAPHGLGTEMTLRAETPVPDLVTGAVTFTALYRARALLQTGETPTLRGTPAARGTAGDE